MVHPASHPLSALETAEPAAALAALNAEGVGRGAFVSGSARAVLGEGPEHADVVFVGEQPGDREDREGRPFVGPAGKLLDRAMAEAGIARERCYLTNAVKHFKFVHRGKRRLHQRPTAGEVRHYRWWLMGEIALIEPRLVVALGATALLALAGKALPVSRLRGPAELAGRAGFVTVHPSSILRAPEAVRPAAYAAFVEDMRKIRALGFPDPGGGEGRRGGV